MAPPKGFIPWNKGIKGLHFSPATEFKKGQHSSPKTEFKKGQVSLRKGKKQPQSSEIYAKRVKSLPRGSAHYNWKGGISSINEIIRRSIQYKLWRKSVFERDRWTCVWCGYKGKSIHADHIKRFSQFPELRFAIDNGRTLCIPCHRSTDTWGTSGLKNFKTNKTIKK